MGGLDKIIERIDADAKYAYNQLINQTEEEVHMLLQNEKQEEEKQQLIRMEQIELKVQQMISRAKSASALEQRKTILQVKQELIHEVIEEAQEILSNLSEDDYLERLRKLLAKHAQEGAGGWKTGEIILSKEDKQHYGDKLTSECSTYSLRISDTTRNIKGGFILQYGEIEENCTFEAIFTANADNLQDQIHNILFNVSENESTDTIN